MDSEFIVAFAGTRSTTGDGPSLLESTAAYKGYACPNQGVKAIAQQCAICGKKPVAGNNVSHSKVRTRRRFVPNLQAATVVIAGKRVKARVCTRCLRTSSKYAAI